MGITSRGFTTFDPAVDKTKQMAEYITKDSKENMELLDTQLTTLEESITNKVKLNNESIQNVDFIYEDDAIKSLKIGESEYTVGVNKANEIKMTNTSTVEDDILRLGYNLTDYTLPYKNTSLSVQDGVVMLSGGSGEAILYSHNDNMIFCTDGEISGYGVSVSVSNNVVTFNGVATTSFFLKISNGLDISEGRKASWINDNLPYEGGYTICLEKISGNTSPPISIAIRNKSDVGLLGTQNISSGIVNNATYIYLYIGSGYNFDNVSYKLTLNYKSSQKNSISPNNKVFHINENSECEVLLNSNETIELLKNNGNYSSKFTSKFIKNVSPLGYSGSYEDLSNIKPIYYQYDMTGHLQKEVLHFYIRQSNNKYIHYKLIHDVKPYVDGGTYQNSDCWRLFECYISSFSNGLFTDSIKLMGGGAWECAMEINGYPDFIGTFHGYEKVQSINIRFDGEIKDLNTNFSGRCDIIEIYYTSKLIKQGTLDDYVCDAIRHYEISSKGVRLKQNYKWLQSLTMKYPYITMLPISRDTNSDGTGIKISQEMMINDDLTKYDLSLNHQTPLSGKAGTGRRLDAKIIDMYSNELPLKTTVELVNPSTNYLIYVANDTNIYNKIYYSHVPSGHSTSIGETWLVETKFSISTQ